MATAPSPASHKLYKHRVFCSYCHSVVTFDSPAEKIALGERKCLRCDEKFVFKASVGFSAQSHATRHQAGLPRAAVNWPYCSTRLIYSPPNETIRLAERTCLRCGKGFLIENNVAKRLPAKKRPQGI